MNQGLGDLPPSTDKKFWNPDGLAEMRTITIRKPDLKHGNYKQVGQDIICTLCANQHTLVTNGRYTVINGELKKI